MNGLLTHLALLQGKAAAGAENVAGAESAAQEGTTVVPPPGAPLDTVTGSYWMPPSATTNTESVDWLFYGILGLTIFCFVAITAVIVYFTWKYRHRPGHKAEPSSSHNDALEITWTVIPSILCVFIFVWGWEGFVDMYTPPKHAEEIQVTGGKWFWTFDYMTDGFQVSDPVLHVPADRPVRLVMKSQDVLHSFFIPSFRMKHDVIPNRYSKIWFEAKDPGVYRANCAEYCGTDHSQMKTWVQVHEPGGYENWLDGKKEELVKLIAYEPDKWGKYLYENKGCKNCHTIDGRKHTGPTFKGLWGRQEKLSDGTTVLVDEEYIKNSIWDPQLQIVAGYGGNMPTFRGQVTLKEIGALIAFLKTLE